MNNFHIEGLHKVLHSVFIYLFIHMLDMSNCGATDQKYICYTLLLVTPLKKALLASYMLTRIHRLVLCLKTSKQLSLLKLRHSRTKRVSRG